MQSIARRLSNPAREPWPDRPVPIGLTITDLDVGGAERALVALALGLNRRRWNPSVFCLGPEGELTSTLRRDQIDVSCLGIVRRDPARAIAKLAEAYKARRIRLSQSFLFHADIASRLAAPIAGVRWVVGGIRVAEKRKNRHLLWGRLTQRLTNGSVCVSRGVERFARIAGKIAPERLIVIPNGIDPAPFDRAEPAPRATLGVPDSAFLCLFLGRLEAQKGVGFLLDAAERVVRRRSDWYLAIAGDGRDAAELKRLSESRPLLADRLIWLGRRSDAANLLKTADLLVLPSLWEGMPNVILEAMAAGRAVAATSVEGSEELVEPGRTGWLVPPADSSSLAEALLDAAQDRDRLVRFGRQGRLKVEAEYSLARVHASYESLWAGLLGFRFPEESNLFGTIAV